MQKDGTIRASCEAFGFPQWSVLRLCLRNDERTAASGAAGAAAGGGAAGACGAAVGFGRRCGELWGLPAGVLPRSGDACGS